MDTIYNSTGRLVGYFKGNSIYDRDHSVIGYIQESLLIDKYRNPVAYAADDAIHTMAGVPWAYFDGQVLRDIHSNRLGRVRGRGDWKALLSAGLLLGEGIGWQPARYGGNPAGNYGLAGGLLGNLGNIGSTLKNLLNVGARGYGAGNYAANELNSQEQYRKRNHRDDQQGPNSNHKNSKRKNDGGHDSNSSRRNDNIRDNRSYQKGNSNEENYSTNPTGLNMAGLGKMLINNIGPITAMVGKYVQNGGNLGKLGGLVNLLNTANLAGLNGLGRVVDVENAKEVEDLDDTASSDGLENPTDQIDIEALTSALASMFGGMNGSKQEE